MSGRDPAICTGGCRPPMPFGYCTRCIARVKARLMPGVTNRAAERRLDALSRERALSEAESVVLHYAMTVNAIADRQNARRRGAGRRAALREMA